MYIDNRISSSRTDKNESAIFRVSWLYSEIKSTSSNKYTSNIRILSKYSTRIESLNKIHYRTAAQNRTLGQRFFRRQ